MSIQPTQPRPARTAVGRLAALTRLCDLLAVLGTVEIAALMDDRLQVHGSFPDLPTVIERAAFTEITFDDWTPGHGFSESRCARGRFEGLPVSVIDVRQEVAT